MMRYFDYLESKKKEIVVQFCPRKIVEVPNQYLPYLLSGYNLEYLSIYIPIHFWPTLLSVDFGDLYLSTVKK